MIPVKNWMFGETTILQSKESTLPESNISAETGWLEDAPASFLGFGLFSGVNHPIETTI